MQEPVKVTYHLRVHESTWSGYMERRADHFDFTDYSPVLEC